MGSSPLLPGCSHKFGVLFLGDLLIRAPVLGVYQGPLILEGKNHLDLELRPYSMVFRASYRVVEG